MSQESSRRSPAQGPVTYRELKLCSNKGAYEVIPSARLDLDLESIRRALEAEHREVLDARVMLVVQGKPETTISQDGRVLFKTRDEKEARRCMETILPLVLRAGKPRR
jgi:hypothetical protein